MYENIVINYFSCNQNQPFINKKFRSKSQNPSRIEIKKWSVGVGEQNTLYDIFSYLPNKQKNYIKIG